MVIDTNLADIVAAGHQGHVRIVYKYIEVRVFGALVGGFARIDAPERVGSVPPDIGSGDIHKGYHFCISEGLACNVSGPKVVIDDPLIFADPWASRWRRTFSSAWPKAFTRVLNIFAEHEVEVVRARGVNDLIGSRILVRLHHLVPAGKIAGSPKINAPLPQAYGGDPRAPGR